MNPSSTSRTGRRQPPTWLEAAGIVAALALVVGLMLLAFGLPAVNGGPHDVPLGIVAPPAGAAAADGAPAEAAPRGFVVRRYGDEHALREAIVGRDVYGGFVLPAPGRAGPGVRVLTASAASPAIAQTVGAIGTAIAGRNGTTATIVDVRPLPADDPRGAGLAAVGLPLVLGGVLPALVLTRRFPGKPGVRVGAAVAFALLEGALVAAVLTWWFGSVDANFAPVALGIALGMGAVALTVLGLEALLGIAGFGLGAAFFVLLGNPLSGLASGPEFLPSGWGAFGQALPPGATATLLRANAYFDGAGAARPLTVLTCWAAAGLLLVALSTLRTRRAPASAQPAGAASAESAGPGSAGPGSAGRGSAGRGSAGRELAGRELAGPGSAGDEAAGSEAAGSGTAGHRAAGGGSASAGTGAGPDTRAAGVGG